MSKRAADPGEIPDPLDTVLDAAVLLQDSGQSTSTTLLAVDRLNSGLGVRSRLIPSWESLILVGDRPRVAAVSPTAIDVITDRPWQPIAANEARSAWMPVAPTGSATLKLITSGEVWFCTGTRLRYPTLHFT